MKTFYCVFLISVFFVLLGCAVGRGPAGEVVLGVKAGELVETTEEATRALINAGSAALGGVIPGWGVFAGAAGTVVASIFGAKKHADAKSEAAARAAETAAWDEAKREAERERQAIDLAYYEGRGINAPDATAHRPTSAEQPDLSAAADSPRT